MFWYIFCKLCTLYSLDLGRDKEVEDEDVLNVSDGIIARSASSQLSQRNSTSDLLPPLRSARESEPLEGRPAAKSATLRLSEPLLKPEMLDNLLKPGPKLDQNLRYIKAEMARYASQLEIERQNSADVERVRLRYYAAHVSVLHSCAAQKHRVHFSATNANL